MRLDSNCSLRFLAWSLTMKTFLPSLALISLFAITGAAAAQNPSPQEPPPVNPAIDMPGYLRVAAEAAKYRETHRLAEAEFIRVSRQPDTLVLDCRSKQKFDLLHIQGA